MNIFWEIFPGVQGSHLHFLAQGPFGAIFLIQRFFFNFRTLVRNFWGPEVRNLNQKLELAKKFSGQVTRVWYRRLLGVKI
jgi:hypothetical protein